jgi:hypothetical protein
MIAHASRTQTIAAWTGLPKQRIRAVNNSHVTPERDALGARHRGPSPTQVKYLLRTARLRSEAAALLGLCLQFHLVPRQPLRSPARDWPEVARGERLCDAFEMYRMLMPSSPLTLDHLVVLVLALAKAQEVTVACCTGCGSAIVSDRFGEQRLICQHCASLPTKSPRAPRIQTPPVSDSEDVQDRQASGL